MDTRSVDEKSLAPPRLENEDKKILPARQAKRSRSSLSIAVKDNDPKEMSSKPAKKKICPVKTEEMHSVDEISLALPRLENQDKKTLPARQVKRSRSSLHSKTLNRVPKKPSPPKNKPAKGSFCNRLSTSFTIQPPQQSAEPHSASLVIKQPLPKRATLTSHQLITSTLVVNSSFSSSDGIDTSVDESLFSDIPSHLPAVRASCNTPNGTPLNVDVVEVQENGEAVTHQLKLALRTDAINIYSNDPELKPAGRIPTTTVCKSHPAFNKETVAKVKSAQADYKVQTLDVTPEQQNKKIICANRNQNRIMATSPSNQNAASATKYMEQFDLELDKCEWLHLIAYFVAGEKKQIEANLVAGTAHANTDMLIAIERHILLIEKAYPENFRIRVKADLRKHGTQIANAIYYKIITDDFEFSLTFNAQATNKPHVVYEVYFRKVIEHMIAKHANKNEAASSSSSLVAAHFISPKKPALPNYERTRMPDAPHKVSDKNSIFSASHSSKASPLSPIKLARSM